MGVTVRTWVWAGLLLRLGWASGACIPMGEGEVFLVGGDVVLTELLPLHTGRDCSKLGLTEMQIMEATRLAVQKVNELELIPGVTLGLRVVDTCGKSERSVKMALASLADDTRDCINPAVSLGFLGPGDAASASAVGRATRSLHVPLLAYGPRPASVRTPVDLVAPAPQRSAKAVTNVLAGAGIRSMSVVHTADVEGEVLMQHFITAAEDGYRCLEKVLKAEDPADLVKPLRKGPGTVVLLGTRHKVQKLARFLGAEGGPAEILVLQDTGGPVPVAELEGVTTPTILLQRIAEVLPDFSEHLQRDLSSEDGPRRQYVAALSECSSCDALDFAYDAAAPAAAVAVLTFAQALREAQAAHCGPGEGLCEGVRLLEYQEWKDLLSQASPSDLASEAFPGLDTEGLSPGAEDIPRYAVKLLSPGNATNLTQVGHADEISAVLGQLELKAPRCGKTCPCIRPKSTPRPRPPPGNLEIKPTPPRDGGGLDILGGAGWWSHVSWWPGDMPDPAHLSQSEVTAYVTAFFLLVVLFMSSTLACIYNLQKSPSRS
ncbi:Metabotropic glutamate receptor 3 [Penaeus vannamei]|uniref:Metabotropic glutamate receptor 3 n=1 Tax=Penaeus vannamei TaxID=6689 RepID=A0A423TAV0_PENVA|nr:Metabotropic glutamate receptor 3 [Penaeus vannamei]